MAFIKHETRFRYDHNGRQTGLDWNFHRAPEPEPEDQDEA